VFKLDQQVASGKTYIAWMICRFLVGDYDSCKKSALDKIRWHRRCLRSNEHRLKRINCCWEKIVPTTFDQIVQRWNSTDSVQEFWTLRINCGIEDCDWMTN
jgi:hypothetical protein